MAELLTDDQIAHLLTESKPLPGNFQERIRFKPKRGHKEAELDITGADSSTFRIVLRQSALNPLDFSVILAYQIPQTNVLFRLRRYNGKSHEHSNRLEGDRFYDFHIHQASQRYQESGLREDAFAEPTTRYADFDGALRCLWEDAAFTLPDDFQPGLTFNWSDES
jgi:hypothetical protein